MVMSITNEKFLHNFSNPISVPSPSPAKCRWVALSMCGPSPARVEGLCLLNMFLSCSCHIARGEQMLGKHLFELNIISYVSIPYF